MERFKILLLTVAVLAQAMSQNSTTESPVQISKPKITVNPDHGVLYNTESVTLSCEISEGPPGLQYDWYKDSKDLGQHQRSITVNENGKYECKGKRRETRSEKSDVYTLTLKDPPKAQLTVNPEWTEYFVTEKINLRCKIEDGSSGWIFEWIKDSWTSEKDDVQTLNVKHSDSGEYSCRGKLSNRQVTTQQSNTFQLKVKEMPQSQVQSDWTEAFPGEKVTLKCKMQDALKNCNYMWFKGQTKIVSSGETNIKGNSLTLSVQSSHDGEYVCQAELHHRKVTTEKSAPHSLKVHGSKPTLHLQQDPSYSEIYTGEQVKLTCNIQEQTSQWEYQWKKDSTQENSHIYIIPSAELSHDGSYTCQVGRRGTTFSQSIKLTIRARPPALLSLETELGDIMTGYMTLRCNVSDGRNWNYTWFMDGQQLNASSDVLRVTGNEENIRREFKCKGINTVRPLYSALSDGFIANNIIFKRKILLAISGCLVCCIVILIIGCIILKVTRKPEVKETAQEDLFFSMTDFKNQTASPMKEYMDNRPSELEDCEEKEELITGRASAAHEDAVIKDEDTPASETNGMTSFKGL
ncbi:Fc receptor-like protein 3 isoform X2 [Puntigrus tetrazona]|uniref:Fc receptor-like protein 3 isoform X2 n=1 Tax=Puntigrus tetrazona TaxID=1606681 RepID=UPI001C8A3A85|nr:Fc receptor-like protein 3 isoform X2 [Puntigrus tetrazona]